MHRLPEFSYGVKRQRLGLLELSRIDAEVRHGRRQRDNMPEV